MRLRIAVLSRNFCSTGGGAERYSIALVEQLAARHEVHVFAQTIQHAALGVRYHLVPMPLRRPRWVNQLYFASVTWWATRRGFDIVHSHENTWHGNVQTVHVVPILHNLFVGREHGLRHALRWLKVMTSPRLLTYLLLERGRSISPEQRKLVATSRTLLHTLRASYPAAAAAMEAVPPGVEPVADVPDTAKQQRARQRLGLPEPGRCILFVGNDFRKKGLPTLLQTLGLLPADVYLAVVGQCQHEAPMRQQAQAAGVAQRVYFLGALADMGPAYTAANCLAHPTLEDTYAMVVLEAMAHGLPVVVSSAAYCGISAELEHGVQALIVNDPRSPTTLEAALRAILLDGQLASNLSTNARRFAQAQSWEAVAQRYEQLYEQLCADRTQQERA